MNTQAHTPTPWITSSAGRAVSDIGGNPIAMCDDYGIGDEQRKANAAHIVKCVNAHDELVAALRKFVDLPGLPAFAENVYDARAILAKAQA